MIKDGSAGLRISKLLNRMGIKKEVELVDDIFDYRKVTEIRGDSDKGLLCTNGHYGLSYILKRYSGYQGSLQCAIEHAPYLEHDLSNVYEYRDNDLPTLLVCAKRRADFLKAYTNKIMMPFGPSIFYAQDIYNSFDMDSIKQNLGKTLLIFPQHNVENTRFCNSHQAFIEYVRNIKKQYNYDTVLVCIYFVDLKRGLHIPYEREGWTIISAGNRKNIDFNDCLRTIINLSDCVINQGYSSNIGYAIYLGKPVNYFVSKRTFVENNIEDIQSDDLGISERRFEILFSEYQERITDEQYQWCKYIYGYEDVKSPQEIKEFFEFSEKMKKMKDTRIYVQTSLNIRNYLYSSRGEFDNSYEKN